ncbi:MAG: peptidoglycan DD-metalloendopeptidase family protein [Alphaproteobacteria bacterium]|nr:peptidoglycan DD-metalloendopeptidase family protein [Alphaproteobacteria bacterium]
MITKRNYLSGYLLFILLLCFLVACNPLNKYTKNVPPVPLASAEPIVIGTPIMYKVKAKDTVHGLSNYYKISKQKLIEANQLKPPFRLYVGQSLIIPKSSVSITQLPQAHVVDRIVAEIQPLSDEKNNTQNKNDKIEEASINIPRMQFLSEKSENKNTVSNSYEGKNLSSEFKLQEPEKAMVLLPVKEMPKQDDLISASEQKIMDNNLKVKEEKLEFFWPIEGKTISEFGPKKNGAYNDGINIEVKEGKAVKASAGGIVAYAGNQLKGFGNLVLIRHADNWITAYAHNKSLLVKVDDIVKRGDIIAEAGKTGYVSKPQLHFEIRQGENAVNPLEFLKKQPALVSSAENIKQ